jgi:GNAT superfamily N-acetyltransferase
MQTVLETIPEFAGDELAARKLIPNFEFEQMRAMYARDLHRPETHRLVVAECSGEVVGHVIYFLRAGEAAGLVGYLFTIYVMPAHRERGVAAALMRDAISWLEGHGATTIVAHTHVSNFAFRRLADRFAFRLHERLEQPWPHWHLVRSAADYTPP